MLVFPVILSGGAGTRLWPMSRALRPKQLLSLVTQKSMLQETALRVTGPEFAPPIIVGNEEHRFMIAEQLRELDITPLSIVLEPVGRNTAPAAAVAAMLVAERDPDGILLLLPSDHVVGDLDAFKRCLSVALTAAQDGALVTFGIQPTAPETGYGYIQRGEPYPGVDGCFRLSRFVEKPDRTTAQTYLESGAYFWNSGMFVLPVRPFLDELARLKPEMHTLCRHALASAKKDLDFLRLAKDPFNAVEADSIDYAVMEHTAKGAVIPAAFAWSDVGSWSTLWEITDKDAVGNVVIGDAMVRDSRNCYVRSEGNLVAAIGLENLVVVATDDVILVASREKSQEVKQIVGELERAGRTEHYIHTRVFRPWGWYQQIHQGYRFQVKEILVNPGEKLSRQMHHHRAEHWVVVSGTAKVTKDNETFYITEDQSTYIPHTTRHSLENPGKIPLRMIEVQSGPYLGEDDIIRFEDSYGRVPTAAE